MISGFKGVLGFLTIIPVGRNVDLKETARYSWMFPIAGAIIALFAAVVENVSSVYFSSFISGGLALFALLVLTGFHHLDGLLDFGDALMFRGSVEDRQKIMHDVNTGAGGFALGFFVLLLSYIAIAESYDVFIPLIVAETSAKFSMVFGCFIGKPSHEGMGSIFMNIGLKEIFLSFVIYALLTLPLAGFSTFLTVAGVTVVSSLLIVWVSNRSLGGLSGDVLGAMNELTRMFILLALL